MQLKNETLQQITTITRHALLLKEEKYQAILKHVKNECPEKYECLSIILNLFTGFGNYEYMQPIFEEFCESILIDIYNLCVKAEIQDDDPRWNNFFQNIKNIDITYVNTLQYKIISKIQEHYSDIDKKVDDYVKKAEEITKKYNEAADRLHLENFAGHFQTISVEEKKAQKNWLIASIVLGGITLGVIGWSAWQLFTLSNEAFLLEKFILRLIYCFIFLFAALWCGKRYSFSRSQSVIYRHLGAVLTTYDVFKDNTPIDERGIVLTEMAHALFPIPPVTLKKVDDGSDWVKIVDLLKVVSQARMEPKEK